MRYKASTPKEYLEQIPEDQRAVVKKLRAIVRKNLPAGFKEGMQYGMISYFVPHSVYPDGYHCDPKEPLPFMSIGAQKNFVGFYHMGVYSDPKLLKWFEGAYAKATDHKLDMGKSCVRLKKYDDVPYDVFGALSKKISSKQWIAIYEKHLKR